MRLELSAATKNEARFMKNAFDSDPEGMLRSVYELFTGVGRISDGGGDPDRETYKA